MDPATIFQRAAELADQSRREIAALVYDPAAWSALTQAGKLASTIDLTQHLKAAAESARYIAHALSDPRETTEISQGESPNA